MSAMVLYTHKCMMTSSFCRSCMCHEYRHIHTAFIHKHLYECLLCYSQLVHLTALSTLNYICYGCKCVTVAQLFLGYIYYTACVYGDPHIVTLDGKKYTFNGKGEFTLIETPDNSFTLQARMVEATDTDGVPTAATAFSAIVAKENNSDTVQFELTENKTLIAVVNGETLNFTGLPEQEFNKVIVSNLHGNSSFSAAFFSSAYVEVKEENGIRSVLIVSHPKSFHDTPTFGLMGSFNGNSSDDLLPKLASQPLPPNATLEEIHTQFGITCKCMQCRNSKLGYYATLFVLCPSV